jgi:rRNA maturation protein Nop10
MPKLKKCKNCSKYTLKETCPQCQEKTFNPHYKYIKPTKQT